MPLRPRHALPLLLALACARDERVVIIDPPAPPPATADELRAAEHALAAYLEASREGSATAGARDALLGCDARDAFVLPISLLGAYRVLPASGAGDTLLGRAVVATVAEQRAERRSPGRYVARLRTQTDTVEWDVVRHADGVWRVCNGLRFGLHEPADRTTWFPLGASRASARRLADSVRARWLAEPAETLLRSR